MKLFLLGATGKAGSALLDQALQRGYLVTVFVRTPAKIIARHPNLTVVQGDALDIEALNVHLPGHDAVISALSPGTLKHSTLLRRFMEAVTVAMTDSGVKRLLVLSVTFLFHNAGLLTLVAGKTIFRNIKRGSQEMEEVVQNSGLVWTIIRLPRLTADGRAGEYHVRPGHVPPARSISRGTLARFVLTEVERNQFLRTVVGISA
jgi:putative NADH-flavin reductase